MRAVAWERTHNNSRHRGKESWQRLWYRVNQAINDYIEPNANIDKYEIKWGKPNFPSRREERLIFYFFLLSDVFCCCYCCMLAAVAVHVSFSSSCALLCYFFACLQSRHVYVIEFIGLKRICMQSQESRNQMSIKIKKERRSEAKKRNTTHINLKWRLYYSLLFDWRWRRRRLMFELGAAAVYRSSPLIRLSFMPFSLFILLFFFKIFFLLTARALACRLHHILSSFTWYCRRFCMCLMMFYAYYFVFICLVLLLVYRVCTTTISIL